MISAGMQHANTPHPRLGPQTFHPTHISLHRAGEGSIGVEKKQNKAKNTLRHKSGFEFPSTPGVGTPVPSLKLRCTSLWPSIEWAL